MIERHFDATAINSVLNDPIVRPWVADMAEGEIDVSEAVSNPNNFLLMGEHGGCMFFRLFPGIYEVHTQVLPSGRGAWTSAFTHAAAHWMFTRTDAYEVLTRVPQGHHAAAAAARGVGMKFEFTRPDGCLFRGRQVPVHIYGRRVYDWMIDAPDLVERGAWFHEFMAGEAKRLGITEPPHADDENHNRYVGACIEMALAGQVQKATILYNRWALVSRHPTIQLLTLDPPTIRFDIGLLRLTWDALGHPSMEVVRDH